MTRATRPAERNIAAEVDLTIALGHIKALCDLASAAVAGSTIGIPAESWEVFLSLMDREADAARSAAEELLRGIRTEGER